MRAALRVALVGCCCLSIALGAVSWLTGLNLLGVLPRRAHGARRASNPDRNEREPSFREADHILAAFADPNARSDEKIYIYDYTFDSGVYQTAADFMAAH